jgi:serine/threonine-protein kinase
MNPEDWNEIKQVFSAALALPPAERDAHVRAAAGDRPGLREAVEELLRAHYGASLSFLAPGSVLLSAPWLLGEGDSVARRFTVVRRIARGAMGEVYQVHDERLRQTVALKAIRPELIGDADTAERFRREVLVTRHIGHPGVCKVFDLVEHQLAGRAGVADGTIVPCLTMQFLEGESLEEWLAERRPLTPGQALPLVAQIGDALQALHDAGVVHRDLKPSNVMITTTPEGPRAVLTDFGLARPLKTDLFETQVRVQGGAPFFMAPELFESTRPSRASDMYAFGLLIDEMVTTRRAFAADSLHGLLLQKLGDGPERPSKRAVDLPRAWEQVIEQCVARDPRDRPARATSVAESLVDGAAGRGRLSASLRTRVTRRFRYATAAATVVVGSAVLVPISATPTTTVFIHPFQNLTGQPDLDYLEIGSAGELGRRIARLAHLRVHRLQESEPPAEARDGALTLSGHIQGQPAELRITVELKDAATDALLWSQNIDGRSDRTLQLEEQLGAAAAGALMRLGSDRRSTPVAWTSSLFRRAFPSPRLPAMGTDNNDAYQAYLRAGVLFNDRTHEGAVAALTLLREAIDEDPNFALAYALMADVQGVLMDGRSAAHVRFIDEADRYAVQAVALQSDLADGHLALAAVRQAQWRWTESEAAYLRALQLFGGSARAHRWYGGLLLQFGRFEEGLELYRRSIDIDPYDYPGQSAYGGALFNAGRAQEAAAQLEWLLGQKDLFNAHALLGQVYAYLGRAVPAERDAYLRKALAQADTLRRHESAGGRPTTPFADLVGALAWVYRQAPLEAAPYIDRLERGRAAGQITPGTLARVYGAQGDAPRAMAALLEAEAQRDRELLYINVSPHYATIRQDPAFRALVDRLRLAN